MNVANSSNGYAVYGVDYNAKRYGPKVGLSNEFAEDMFKTSKRDNANTPDVIVFKKGIHWEGGPGHYLAINYAEQSTEADPILIAEGKDYDGREFKQEIHLNDIDPDNASYVEMAALKAHLKLPGVSPMSLGKLAEKTSYFEESGLPDYQEYIDKMARYGLSVKDDIVKMNMYKDFFENQTAMTMQV